ncbi:MAG: glycoside hydrolase, partial [Cyanobacteria bacterium P01_F01_bin.42]
MVAVHVLIDLHWQKAVGGHVKSWMQFARAAQKLSPSTLDLTLHFQGDRPEEIPQSANVRYVTHPPRFSTEKLPFLQDVPSHTDLASSAPSLKPYLQQADVVHVTHPLFTFGQTAQKFCDQTQKTLVSSIHTDSAQYAKIYLEDKLEKIFGKGPISNLLNCRLALPQKYRQGLEKKQSAYWKSCKHVWFSQVSERQQLGVDHPELPISRLRRGMNLELFDPAYGDRDRLYQQYGVPKSPFLALFVGRLD